MKFVPNAVSVKLARQILITQKHSPAILFGAGVVGMVTTTVLACKATLRVEEVLEKTQEDLKTVNDVIERRVDIKAGSNYNDRDAKKDKAYVYLRAASELGRLYAPAVACGVLSVSALAYSHNILTKRNAALTAAYAAVDKAFKEYRDRVRSEVGPNREEELYRNITDKREVEDPVTGKKKTIKTVGKDGLSMYARFFDCNSSSWSPEPAYNVVFLRCQQNYANDQLQARGHVFLNEVYDMLGLPRSQEGQVVGWVRDANGDGYIDFGVFDGPANDKFFDFATGREGGVWLDFNVDGVVFDKI